MTPPRGVEDAAPYILGREPSANRRGGLPPSLAPLVRHPSTPPRRGRACPARSLASAPGFVLHPLYLLHRREGLRGCEQGPRLSGAKPGCEQCLPLRANNRTSVFAKQTGGARCAPPSVDPSAASRQIPSMFRPQGKIHPPPSTSRRRDPTHKTASPFRILLRKGLALLTFIPYYNRETFTLRPAARRNPVRRCGPSRPLLHCRQRSCRRRCGRCTGPSWPCR